jgi:hypothetical protein
MPDHDGAALQAGLTGVTQTIIIPVTFRFVARPEKSATGFFVARKPMAARTRKIRHDEETRAKIQSSQIVNRLMDHINGNVELSATQVSSALGLLRKTLPDLAAVEHSGEIETKRANEMSDDELASIAAGSSTNAASAPDDPQVVH